MKVALIQMEIAEKNTPGNIVHGLDLLQEAAANSDIAVLPEIWTTGYSLGRIEEEAETIDGSTIAAVRKIANNHHCAVVAGSIPLRHKDGKIYNNTVVIDKHGSVVASYSKVHLFGLFNEERFFAAGDNFDTYELNGVICGSTICYDLRFPELYRHLSLQGAKIIFVPAEWPSARGNIWTLLSQARGAENHNYIVAVNCVGNFKGAPFYGHSMVVDPMGKIIAEGGSAEEIIYCDIDLAYIDKVRARLNALADVRKELI